MKITELLGYQVTFTKVAKDLAHIMLWYVLPMLGIVAIFWAIWIGYAFWTAKDDGARATAKNRLIKAIASVLIIGVLLLIMGLVNSAIEPAPEEPEIPDDYIPIQDPHYGGR